MGKIVRRMMLDDWYAIGRTEHWLADMAARGLHLKKFGISFAHFEKGEPKQARYRLDITYGVPEQEQQSLYHDCGWDYVTRLGEIAVFTDNGNAQIPELHNDTVVQSYTFAKLDKQLKNTMLLVVALVVLMVLMILAVWASTDELVLSMMDGPLLQQIVLIVVDSWVASITLRKYKTLHKLRQGLQNGVPINHTEPYKKQKQADAIVSGLMLTLALTTCIFPALRLTQRQTYTYPGGNALPVVDLAVLEQNPALVPSVHPDPRTGADHDNRVEVEWSLFAPEQYEVRQTLTDGEDEIHLTQRYFRLSIAALAQPLLEDLQRRYIWRQEVAPSEIFSPAPGSIWMVAHPSEGSTAVFAQQGNQVLYLVYYGDTDQKRLLALMEQALAE